MKTKIIQMLRFGSGYSVKLECGCAFRATPDDVKRQQLFIGKPMLCEECGLERQ